MTEHVVAFLTLLLSTRNLRGELCSGTQPRSVEGFAGFPRKDTTCVGELRLRMRACGEW